MLTTHTMKYQLRRRGSENERKKWKPCKMQLKTSRLMKKLVGLLRSTRLGAKF